MDFITPDKDPKFAEESLFETVVNPRALPSAEYRSDEAYPQPRNDGYINWFNFIAGSVTGAIIVALFHFFTKR